MNVYEVTEIHEGVFDTIRNLINPVEPGATVARGRAGTPLEGMTIQRARRGFRLTFPDGTTTNIRNTSRDTIASVAGRWNTQNRPGFRVEPRLNPNDPFRPTDRQPVGPDIRATRDAPTGDTPELRNTSLDPVPDAPEGSDLRADPRDRAPGGSDDTKPKGVIAKIKDSIMDRISSAGKFASGGAAGAVGAIISAVLTAVEVEEDLDRFLRVVDNELDRQRSEGVSESDLTWTEAMEQARMDCIDNLVDLTLNLLAATILTVGATSGIWAALGFLIGSGPVGWIAAIVGGGVIGFYGAEGVAKILEWTGVKEDINQFIADNILQPSAMMAVAGFVDSVQVVGDDPTFGGNAQPQQAEESLNEAKREAQIMAKFNKAMEQNPKLKQAFDKGKEFGREVKQNLD